jgi:hypothetical protein
MNLVSNFIRSRQESEPVTKVNKCPKCGAIIDPTTGVCPDCQYEMSGFKRKTIVEELTLQINQANKLFSRGSEAKVVENFPIPSNRQDLLEIMAFLYAKVKSETSASPSFVEPHDDKTKAYFRKFQECVIKAQSLYPGDSNFELFINDYYALTKAKKRKKMLFILGFIIFYIIFFWALWYFGIMQF